jgi:hypothetical protein
LVYVLDTKLSLRWVITHKSREIITKSSNRLSLPISSLFHLSRKLFNISLIIFASLSQRSNPICIQLSLSQLISQTQHHVYYHSNISTELCSIITKP